MTRIEKHQLKNYSDVIWKDPILEDQLDPENFVTENSRISMASKITTLSSSSIRNLQMVYVSTISTFSHIL